MIVAICLSSLEKCLFIHILSPFLNWVIYLLFLSGRVLYNIFWIQVLFIIYMWFANTFSHSLCCLYHFLNDVLCSAKFVNFSEILLIFFFLYQTFLVLCIRRHCPTLSHEDLLLLFLSFIPLTLTFKSIITFELILVDDVR